MNGCRKKLQVADVVIGFVAVLVMDVQPVWYGAVVALPYVSVHVNSTSILSTRFVIARWLPVEAHSVNLLHGVFASTRLAKRNPVFRIDIAVVAIRRANTPPTRWRAMYRCIDLKVK